MPWSNAAFATGCPPFVPAPWITTHFPRGFCSLPIRTTIFVRPFLNSGSTFSTRTASTTRVLREAGPQGLVHHPSADLVARVVDRHQREAEEPRLARELLVVPGGRRGLVAVPGRGGG